MHKSLPNISLSSLPSYVAKISEGSSACIQTQIEVLYTTLTKFNILMKPTMSIKMCSNIAYTKVCGGRHLPHAFYTQKC